MIFGFPGNTKTKRLTFAFSFLLLTFATYAQERAKRSSKYIQSAEVEEVAVELPAYFSSFDLSVNDAEYRISLCADVPNNKRPDKVAYNQQTGHVFLMLQQIKWETKDTLNKVFGFYPKSGLPTLVFKKTKSRIKDNSLRRYDAVISKKLTKEEFMKALYVADEKGKRKYHINKYNCYDYAVLVFNSVAGSDTLPLTHVKFPFIFGKGGSPVGLYANLKEVKDADTARESEIHFGKFVAPASTGRVIPDSGKNK